MQPDDDAAPARSRGALAPPRDRFITRPRLRDFDYVGCHAYHLVVVARNREPLLIGGVARHVADSIVEASEAARFEVLAFVVMPNHVHLLALGLDEGSNAIRLVQRIKQAAGFRYSRRNNDKLWQPSFYDHVLRRDEDHAAIARYILENPVRRGLADSIDAWPFSGGTIFDGRS